MIYEWKLFCNRFFLSLNVDPYSKTCSHKVNQIVDSDTCNFCLQYYEKKKTVIRWSALFIKNDFVRNIPKQSKLIVSSISFWSYTFSSIKLLSSPKHFIYRAISTKNNLFIRDNGVPNDFFKLFHGHKVSMGYIQLFCFF